MKKINFLLFSVLCSTILSTTSLEAETESYEIGQLVTKESSSIDTLDFIPVDKSKTGVDLSENMSNTNVGYKETSEAGMKQLYIPQEISGDFNFEVKNSEPVLSKIQGESENINSVTIEDGIISEITEGIVTTKGGYNQVVDFYLDSTLSTKTQINAASFDGIYLGTEIIQDEVYVKTLISGVEGYFLLDSVSLIPTGIYKTYTHYESKNGELYLFEAIDPLVSADYQVYNLGPAPEELIQDHEYIMDSYGNFVDRDSKAKIEGKIYFQELPFRSTSNYTSSQYKSYLAHKGFSDSEYYNSTNSFIKAQENEGINSLFLLAQADHESYYGTSLYATKCNNFFGRGAKDSDPDNACIEFGFDDANSGIMAQSIFLSQMYSDIEDWKYAGTHPGNKNSGINLYYASDPNWGAKIASHMNDIDTYLKGGESSDYKILKLQGDTQVFYDSGLSKPVNYIFATGPYAGSTKKYVVNINEKETGGLTAPRAVITDETEGAYQIQVDTPIYYGNATSINFSEAKKGSYPNYEDSQKGYVSNGSASYIAKYDNFIKNRFWVSKENTYVMNDVPIKLPGEEEKPYPFDKTCGSLISSTTSNGKIIDEYASSDGKINCIYTAEKENLWFEKSVIKDSTHKDFKVKQSYESGLLSSEIFTEYDAANKVSYTREKKLNIGILDYRVDRYYAKNKLLSESFQEYSSNMEVTYKRKKQYYDSGDLKYRVDNYYSKNVMSSETYQEYRFNELYYKRIKKFSNGKLISRTDQYY